MTDTPWMKKQKELAAQYRKAENDYFAAKNFRNGALFMDAKLRMNDLARQLKEHGE